MSFLTQEQQHEVNNYLSKINRQLVYIKAAQPYFEQLLDIFRLIPLHGNKLQIATRENDILELFEKVGNGMDKTKKLLSIELSTEESEKSISKQEDLERILLGHKKIQLKLVHEKVWNEGLCEEFTEKYFRELMEFVREEREKYSENIYPEDCKVFEWMRYCAVKPPTSTGKWHDKITDIKVVILGQDPCPTPGYANGLAFSCNKELIKPIMRSTERIFEALRNDDVEFKHPGHGDLTNWAKQGVLLLNTVLTIRTAKENSPNDSQTLQIDPVQSVEASASSSTTSSVSEDPDFSDSESYSVTESDLSSSELVNDISIYSSSSESGHIKQGGKSNNTSIFSNSHSECLKKQNRQAMEEWSGVGWETFTDAVIKYISENSKGVVFMLWGKFAQKKKELIDEDKHLVLKTCHPAAHKKEHYETFLECKHFSKANKWLGDNDRGSIDWNKLKETD